MRILVLYTDGLTEAYRNVEAAEMRLVAPLDHISGERHPADRIRHAVLGGHVGGTHDDIAILTVRIASQNENPAGHSFRWLFDPIDVERDCRGSAYRKKRRSPAGG